MRKWYTNAPSCIAQGAGRVRPSPWANTQDSHIQRAITTCSMPGGCTVHQTVCHASGRVSRACGAWDGAGMERATIWLGALSLALRVRVGGSGQALTLSRRCIRLLAHQVVAHSPRSVRPCGVEASVRRPCAGAAPASPLVALDVGAPTAPSALPWGRCFRLLPGTAAFRCGLRVRPGFE